MLIYVPLNQIDDNPYQARQEYGDVAELAADIMRQAGARPDTLGLQQVPSARLVGDDDGQLVPTANLEPVEFLDGETLRPGWRVQLEFGHRRRRAFEYLARNGAPEYGLMPLQLRDLSDEQMLDGVWQENRSRRDLSSVEEAELLARKLERLGNQRAVAEAWGIARATVANKLQLLQLPAEIQQANREGKLSERSALSLAPVVQIMQTANGVKWGDGSSYYGPPKAPDTFIKTAINDPKVTSEDIRKYTQEALRYAGMELPGTIADLNTDQGGDIIKANCTGCPKRINKTCLAPTCLKAKTAVFEEMVKQEAAEVLALPFSDREDDFLHSYEDGEKLAQLWEAGGQRPGTNFVYGLVLGRFAYRPLMDPPGRNHVSQTDRWKSDGRAIIAIGHRGRLPLELLPDGSFEVEDIPDVEVIDDWAKRARQLTLDCRRVAKAAIEEMLLDDVMEFRTITALLQPPDAEATDDDSQMAKALAKHLWERGEWKGYPDGWLEEVEQIARLLDRTGAGRGILKIGLVDMAILCLSNWYAVRKWNWSRDRHAYAQEQISLLRKQYESSGLLSGEALQLSVELDRAAQDIARVMEKYKD